MRCAVVALLLLTACVPPRQASMEQRPAFPVARVDVGVDAGMFEDDLRFLTRNRVPQRLARKLQHRLARQGRWRPEEDTAATLSVTITYLDLRTDVTALVLWPIKGEDVADASVVVTRNHTPIRRFSVRGHNAQAGTSSLVGRGRRLDFTLDALAWQIVKRLGRRAPPSASVPD